jgi:hypothetical protein
MPESMVAYLDWATGIMRINTTYEEWEALRGNDQEGKLTASQIGLLETITHETTHYLQIITTGFLYSLSVEIFEEIKRCLPLPLKSFADIPTSAPDDVAVRLNKILLRLDEFGPHDLTVRSLVESAAFLVQKRTHWINLTPAGYREILDHSCPSEEYRSAYDIAVHYLGDEAFDSYCFLSSLSLCTINPTVTFLRLCEEASTRQLRLGQNLDVRPYIDLLNRINCNLIGTAAEVCSQFSIHPVYTDAVHQLNDLCGRDGFDVITYMAAPYRISNHLAIVAVRPMLFNKISDRYWYLYLPDVLWPKTDTSKKEEMSETLILLAAISSQILGNIGSTP